MGEGSVGGIVAPGCHDDCGLGAFFGGHRGVVATHVCANPAGVDAIDDDIGFFEGVCHVVGVGVECAFAGVVGSEFAIVDVGGGVGIEGERGVVAADVDDSAGRGIFEKREEGLGNSDGTEEVGFECLVVVGEGDGITGDAAIKRIDSGIVDEGVEALDFGRDLMDGSVDLLVEGSIEFDEFDVEGL